MKPEDLDYLFSDIDDFTERETVKHEKELVLAYKKSLTTIRGLLADAYAKFSSGEVLTYAEMVKFGRLEKLQNEIFSEIDKLTGETHKKTNTFLKLMMNETYLRNGYIFEVGFDQNLGFSPLQPDLIQEALQIPVSGLTLNERLEKQRNDVVIAIKQDITQGLIQGKTFKEMSEKVKKSLEDDVVKAHRIVRTETGRIKAEAQLKAMKVAEEKGLVFKKMWISVMDSKTRKSHQKLDGQTVGLDDYFEIRGHKTLMPHKFGRAEEDINCRCRVITRFEESVLNERWVRDEKTGKSKKIDFKTYEDWANKKSKPKPKTKSSKGPVEVKTTIQPLSKTEQMKKELEDMKKKNEELRKEVEKKRENVEKLKNEYFELNQKVEEQIQNKKDVTKLKAKLRNLEKKLKSYGYDI